MNCEGSWIIDGDEFDRNMGTVSMLSSKPLSLAARSLADGSSSKDELPIAAPTGYPPTHFCRLAGAKTL